MAKHAAIRAPKPLHAAHDRHRVPTLNRAPSPSWVSGWRDKIQVTRLINRLQTFALDDPDNPVSKRMTRTQAMIALALLHKCMPNMQALEVSGNADQPITVQVLRFADLDATASLQQNGTEPTHGPQQARPGEPLVIDVVPEHPALIEDEPAKPAPKRGTRSR